MSHIACTRGDPVKLFTVYFAVIILVSSGPRVNENAFSVRESAGVIAKLAVPSEVVKPKLRVTSAARARSFGALTDIEMVELPPPVSYRDSKSRTSLM